ncbi:hypothetical protein CYMTET_50883, partial [Cymbomonas tetramitiformis]
AAISAVRKTEEAVAAAGDAQLVNSEPRLMLLSGGRVDARLMSVCATFIAAQEESGREDTVEEEHVRGARLLIAERCRELLASYTTTLDADQALLKNSDLPYQERHIVQYRVSKKLLLHEAVTIFSS